MALRTRSAVSGETLSEPLMVRETVAVETRATRATSLIFIALSCFDGFGHVVDADAEKEVSLRVIYRFRRKSMQDNRKRAALLPSRFGRGVSVGVFCRRVLLVVVQAVMVFSFAGGIPIGQAQEPVAKPAPAQQSGM